MPHEHPLTYVQALVGRLTALQSRLDRLDDLLPHREIGQEAVREFALIQKHRVCTVMYGDSITTGTFV